MVSRFWQWLKVATRSCRVHALSYFVRPQCDRIMDPAISSNDWSRSSKPQNLHAKLSLDHQPVDLATRRAAAIAHKPRDKMTEGQLNTSRMASWVQDRAWLHMAE